MKAQGNNTITDQVVDIIATQLGYPKEKIVPEAEFETDLGFDSLEQVEFIMNVEEAFNIEIPDEEAEQIKTVKQAIAKIEGALKKQPDAAAHPLH